LGRIWIRKIHLY